MGDRSVLAATLTSLISFAVLLVPAILLSGSVMVGGEGLLHALEAGARDVPPPPEWVKGLPLVGSYTHELWTHASYNLKEALLQVAPQVKIALSWLVGWGGGRGGDRHPAIHFCHRHRRGAARS